MKKSIWLLSTLLILSLVLSACGQTAATEPTEVNCRAEALYETVGSYQVPAPIEGCFNVAFVYVGPHDDGGWSQSHDVGRQSVEQTL